MENFSKKLKNLFQVDFYLRSFNWIKGKEKEKKENLYVILIF